jgi:hypothetical protein
MHTGISAKLLSRDRAIIVLGTAAIALLGWAYLFYQDWGMRTYGPRLDGHAQQRALGHYRPVTGLGYVGSDDGRHGGSVGHTHAVGLCHNGP